MYARNYIYKSIWLIIVKQFSLPLNLINWIRQTYIDLDKDTQEIE